MNQDAGVLPPLRGGAACGTVPGAGRNARAIPGDRSA